MHFFWDTVIEPILNILRPKVIVEIGSDYGETTKQLLDFCRTNAGVLHAIDPAPQFDVAAWKIEYGDHFVFHQSLSLNAIGRIEQPDVVLIDGDHNWYTVFNELKLLEKRCMQSSSAFPLIMLHDTGWPYGRRDLYYNPQTIPDGYRKPYQKMGILPGVADLVEQGGLNAHLFNSIYENDLQNGVLTAIEDFLDESRQPLTFVNMPGLNGLGILFRSQLRDQNQEFSQFLNDLELPRFAKQYLERLEEERIAVQLRFSQKRTELAQQKQAHQAELTQQKQAHQAELTQRQQAHQAELARDQQAHRAALTRLEQAHQTKLTDLQRSANALQTQLAQLNTSLKQRTHEVRRLTGWLDTLNEVISKMLSSRRWRFGNALGDWARRLRFKPRVSTAPDHLNQIMQSYGNWKQNKEHVKIKIHPPVSRRTFKSRGISGLPYPVDIKDPTGADVGTELEAFVQKSKKRPQKARVSIIMPAYNSAHCLDRAILSVLHQHYENYELIVINDGSTDNTSQVLEKYSRNPKVTILTTSNQGPARARNNGLAKSSGKYIAYLDSDNEWYPEYLLCMINILEDNPKISMAYCAQDVVDGDAFEKVRFKIFNRALLENINYIDINSVVHRRELYAVYGGFDEQLPRVEDWDLVLRYTERSFPYCLEYILVKYHKSDHHKNPLKNPRNPEAKLRYQNSIKRIREKIQAKPLDLKSLKELPWLSAALYSNLDSDGAGSCRGHVSVIIPNYEALSCLKACLESIQAYTPRDCYEVVIVDNASSAETIDFLRRFAETNNNCRVIYNDKNMGFTYAVNQGIEAAAKGNDIVLLNNDAIVTEGWLAALQDAKIELPDAAIIVPRQVLPPYTRTMQVHAPFCKEESEIDVTLSVHHENLENPLPVNWEKGYLELSWATFFCVYITRWCIEHTGLLDCESGRHYSSDRAYCDLIRKKYNYRIVYTPHAKVYHLLQQATKELKERNLEEYKVIYEKNSWEDIGLGVVSRKSTP